MTFGSKLQALRTEAELSQEELAARLGVSRQAVSKWELDKAMPDAAYIVAVSELFAVTTDYLLKDDVPRTPPPPSKAAARSPESTPVPEEEESPVGAAPTQSPDPVRVPRLLLTGGSALSATVILLYVVMYCLGFGGVRLMTLLTIFLVLLPVPVLLAVSWGLLGRRTVDGEGLTRYRRSFALCAAPWGFAVALLCGFGEVVDDLLVGQVEGFAGIPLLLGLTAALGLALYCLGLLLAWLLTRKQ